jgi:hypothetical protein
MTGLLARDGSQVSRGFVSSCPSGDLGDKKPRIVSRPEWLAAARPFQLRTVCAWLLGSDAWGDHQKIHRDRQVKPLACAYVRAESARSLDERNGGPNE